MVNYYDPKILKYFYQGDVKIIFFHDIDFSILSQMEEDKIWNSKTYIFISFSWYCSPILKNPIIKENLDKIKNTKLIENLYFLMNSIEELDEIKKGMVDYKANFIYFNNCCFLNDQLFTINKSIKKRYDLVINGRNNKFKRHHLSTNVPNKLFIYYVNDTLQDIPDLSIYNPTKMMYKIPRNQLSNYLNMCRMGAMLSEKEGACYASAEYLLCGLPVISTPSKGGRHVF